VAREGASATVGVENEVTTNLNEPQSRQSNRLFQRYQWAVGVVVLAVIVFMVFQLAAKQKRIKLIEHEVAEAKKQIQEAKTGFDAAVSRIVQAHTTSSEAIANGVAGQLSQIGTIANIVIRLAKDQVTNKTEAESYVGGIVSPIVEPHTKSLREQLANENTKLGEKLNAISVQLAKNVGVIRAQQPISIQGKVDAGNPSADLDLALKELGQSMLVIAIFLPYDVADATTIAAATRRGVVSFSKRLFAVPIRRLASIPLIAIIPIPGLPQIVSLVFLGWSAYAIQQAQDQFRDDARNSTREALTERIAALDKSVRSIAAENVKKFEALQDKIGGMAPR
jgi:hypothetical protein